MDAIVRKKLLKGENPSVQEREKIKKFSEGDNDINIDTIIDVSTIEDPSDLKVGNIYRGDGGMIMIPVSKENGILTSYLILPEGIFTYTIENGQPTNIEPLVKAKIKQVYHSTSDKTFTLPPNEYHVWGLMDNLTISLGPSELGIVSEYMFEFISGSTATVLSLPNNIQFPDDYEIEANKKYQVSIVDNIGLIVGVDYE